MSTNSFTKDIIVARAGRNFVNGKDRFDLTHEDIDGIIRNFTTLGKQVPLLLTPDHVFGGKKSAIPAAGWVESMRRIGDDWYAKVKFVGQAADLVLNDQFRGVSIGTVMARDVHGKPVGEALDHLLITNSPFFSGLNIAARIAATDSAAPGFRYICSEASVAPRSAEEEEADREWGLAIAVAMSDYRKAASAPSPGMLKRIVPDSFAGHGEQPKEESPLLKDPAYQRARAAGDTEAMARIAAEFGRGKPKS